MRAWRVTDPQPVDEGPIELVETQPPDPGPNEIRVRVSVCGVCRTDLHIVEGDLPVHRKGVTPGHEVVGVVESRGNQAGRFSIGDRIGIPWLRETCGRCRFCLRGDENLCLSPGFTGWDADGGYAEMAIVDEAFAYAIPDSFDDEQAAPLLCAGIIGYRALKRAAVPAGGSLGIYGFGGSAHLAAQVAIAQGIEVHVMTRAEAAQKLARALGAASVQGATDPPPVPLDAAILFAPVGDLVLPAMQALDRGGRLAVAGIHLSGIPPLDYERDLFQERELVSVTANTRADGREFLEIAARTGIEVTTTPYPFESADRALTDLAHDKVKGAAVLQIG